MTPALAATRKKRARIAVPLNESNRPNHSVGLRAAVTEMRDSIATVSTMTKNVEMAPTIHAIRKKRGTSPSSTPSGHTRTMSTAPPKSAARAM